jgi:hypothetical protein
MSLNDILKKIAQSEKLELAKHNVELALLDDFKKEANETVVQGDLLKKESNEIEKTLNAYFKLKDDLENQKKSLESRLSAIETRIQNINVGYNRTSKIYQDLVNKTSDLGIDYPKSIDNTLKNIADLVKYSKSISTKNVKL